MTRPKKPAVVPAGTLSATDSIVGAPVTTQAATDAVTPPSTGANIVAPPADPADQSQVATGALDSDEEVAKVFSATVFTDGTAIAGLRPFDPLAIASQLVAGDPNPDLVEAVRQVLATEAFSAPTGIMPVAATIPGAATRRGHVALMHLDMDGRSYEPFDTVFVTEDEFDPLKDATVFDGWWDEGTEET